MAAPWAIRIEQLGKQYELGEVAGRPRSLYESLSDGLTWIAGRRERAARRERFWALREVSFEVAPGEVVGVVGRNGAGKSTLLKVLSRITPPTEGRALLRGNLSSLLEVGTGFHPQLTGRENVFLNGTILGMRRREIERRFDEIVAFAEIEEFLDTPVKRYSSGMYVRLAFAVAAHLVADILLVDEVLAVGDTAFRANCFDKLDATARSGRTVLLVSHDLAAIEGMTTRCLLLERGRLVADGPTQEVVTRYLSEMEKEPESKIDTRLRTGSGEARIVGMSVRDGAGRDTTNLRSGDRLELEISIVSSKRLTGVGLHVGIYDHLGRSVSLLDSEGGAGNVWDLDPGERRIGCAIENLPLVPGRYFFNVALLKGNQLLDAIQRGKSISVEGGDFFGTGRLPRTGVILLRARWLDTAGAVVAPPLN